MNVKEYIESGILELYVYGALSDAEAKDVYETLSKYPEIKEEVEAIENTLTKISQSVAPYNPTDVLASIKRKLSSINTKDSSKVVPITKSKGTNYPAIIGWAASILLIGGIFYLLNENNELRTDLRYQKAQNAITQSKYEDASNELSNSQAILDIVRNENLVKVELDGQGDNTDAYAALYWDTEKNVTYIDLRNMPTPPDGMVYQVWSLKLNPLTPTDIGVLNSKTAKADDFYTLANENASEAFGITLEPEGGSPSPTLERLYVLGAVSS